MPRPRFRAPTRKRRIRPTDIPTAEETVEIAVKTFAAGKWHRRVRRWIRQALRRIVTELRRPR